MISVEEAKNIIQKNRINLNWEEILIYDALGRVTSEDIHSPFNVPQFDQAAMDGYGVTYEDTKNVNRLKIFDTIPAGMNFTKEIPKGNAIRIFTGAKVPKGIDTIIIQEDVDASVHGYISFETQKVIKGTNIRKQGSQLNENACAIEKGTKITPTTIGLLASMGIKKVKVELNPRVSIIITGDELMQDTDAFQEAKIFESNGIMLKSLLKEIRIEDVSLLHCKDDEGEIINMINEELSKADIILITGGISVGKYDFTYSALKKLAIEELFYKIRQKPGKPLFFGKKNQTLVFGMPGNPAAVVTCFYSYILLAIYGIFEINKNKIRLPLHEKYVKKNNLANFLKASIINNGISIHGGQESNVLLSFVNASGLAYIPEEVGSLESGDLVEIQLFK